MNHLLVGTTDKTKRLLDIAKPRFLLIDDGPIADAFLTQFPKAKLFDPTDHSFNPLKGLTPRRARDIATVLYTAAPGGANTLTVRNGRRALARILRDNPTRFDRLPFDRSDEEQEAKGMVDDLLFSPEMTKVLCGPAHFKFGEASVVARIDRAELGDEDALLLALLLIGQTKGQVIVPDFGFYGRPLHSTLIRQHRLIAGVNFLSELEPKLRQAALSMQYKTAYRTTTEDAERLLPYFHTAYSDGEQRTLTKVSQLTEPEGEYLTTLPPAQG